jgi:hypothetical protein
VRFAVRMKGDEGLRNAPLEAPEELLL